MSANSAFATDAYKRAATTVSPLKAVVMVYDELINSLLRTDAALEKNDPAGAFANVEKAAKICRGLRHALDFSAGEAVSEQLDGVYKRMIFALHASFGKADSRARYKKLLEGIVELRNAWAEIGHFPPRTM